MLTVRRRAGQWVTVTHRSGDVLRVYVPRIWADAPGRFNADLGFDGSPHEFHVARPERVPPRTWPPPKAAG